MKIFKGNIAPVPSFTAQKMKFPVQGFFSECERIHSFLWKKTHLLKKSLRQNFILCAVFFCRFDNIY